MLRALALLAVLACAGCVKTHRAPCNSGARMMQHDQLFFGTAKPGGVVDDESWRTFVADVVTPWFPDGLTIWDATGQWRNADGSLARESSHVLTLVHDGNFMTERAIADIIDDYKSRFAQEAVMRVSDRACVSF